MKEVLMNNTNDFSMEDATKLTSTLAKASNIALLSTVLLSFLLTSSLSLAQSAVYVYQNAESGKSDYMFVYGMSSAKEAENWAISKFEELNYDRAEIKKYASTEDKGFGVIIRAVYKSSTGRLLTAYGAALGIVSQKEAEQKAVENLVANNPEWDSNRSYRVIQKFYDEPEAY